jgi:hypothetical protein
LHQHDLAGQLAWTTCEFSGPGWAGYM